MTFEKTLLKGVFVINNFSAVDTRGLFVKTFTKSLFQELNINFDIKESYYSVSQKNVIRGMHFQLPPFDHDKLVFVSKGSILDVVVDLRKKSSTYKKYIYIELSETNRKSIFIPRGLAHGFKSLQEDTQTVYNVSSEYNSLVDAGILYNSFGFDWELDNPIVSQRDSGLIDMNLFCSNNNPF